MDNKATVFLLRFVALLIDGLILGVAIFLVLLLAGIIMVAVGSVLGDSAAALVGVLIGVLNLAVMFAVPFCYYGYMLSNKGTTFGKQAVGLKVSGVSSFLIGGLRGTVGYFISGILLLGYIWYFIDRQNRTWHDIIFKTKVRQG